MRALHQTVPPSGVAAATSVGGSVPASSAFRHEAVFYGDGPDGFVRATLPLIERARGEQGSVLVAVRPANAQALSEALLGRAQGICFVDMPQVGRNPARIIPVWTRFVREHADGPILGVGEPVWPERTAAELDECERHEALLNLAFDDGRGWHLVCPYDIDGLEDAVIEAAQRTHPLLASERGTRRSDAYVAHAAGPLAGELPSRPRRAEELTFGREDLHHVRRRVAAWAQEQSLGVDGCEELVLAVNELATNSVFYGGGGGTLHLWSDGTSALCEVEDQGRMRDPLVGRIDPRPEAGSGRGVWIVNQLCDLVQIRSCAGGTAVRLHKALG